MKKKALCVGINDYPFGEDNDLKGCINDAIAWRDLLVNHYDFNKIDVNILLDSQSTKANIMNELKKLLHGANPGDVLVFTNSSHGTYLADNSGDEENDQQDAIYDEAICPYDCDQNLLIDDELRELFTDLPDNVHLTVISDSCYSGSVTKAVAFPPTPDERRKRFLNPKQLGCLELPNVYASSSQRKNKHPESSMKDILLSGCTNVQYSYDAKFGNISHGAMTYYALQAIRNANYSLTYKQLHDSLSALIKAYPQHPQLEGTDANKQRQLFT